MNGNNRRFAAASVAITVCLLVATSVTTFGQADRETWQPPEKIMDAIGVEPKMRIGEAGAGTGYFTFPLAGRVGPEGIVYANDISTSSLDVIRTRADAEGLVNIEIVVGAVEDPLFPETDLDMVVMVGRGGLISPAGTSQSSIWPSWPCVPRTSERTIRTVVDRNKRTDKGEDHEQESRHQPRIRTR